MKMKCVVIMLICTLFCNSLIGVVNSNATTLKSNMIEIESIGFSEDKILWDQINNDGFGSIYNRAPRGIEIFNDSLIIGTANYNDECRLVMGKEYALRSIFSVYEGATNYDTFQSDGCEIWAYNGSGWKVIVGNSEDAIAESGFGNDKNLEVGFLKIFKGYLYAGLRNEIEGCPLWRTKSIDEEWEQVITDGFDNENNVWFMTGEVFKGHLYAGTYNRRGCEIFRTIDGKNWEAVVGADSNTKAGFESRGVGGKSNFYAWSMCVYRDELYVGTASVGGELWKTDDGLKWNPVIAYETELQARIHGADHSRGFGPNALGGFRRLMVYKDELYILSAVQYDINYFVLKGFGEFIERLTRKINLPAMPPFMKCFYSGTQIWKYNADDDEWTKVIGGFGKKNTCAGFGDFNNRYLWSVEVHDDYLYVGTGHPNSMNVVFTRNRFLNWSASVEIPKGKGELWRFDGENWEQANEDGFGDEYNLGIRVLKSYKNKLYAGTMNLKDGCEIWEKNTPLSE